MSQNKKNRAKAELIKEKGDIQIFRYPDTGEEFSTTISRPIHDTETQGKIVRLSYKRSTKSDVKEAVSLAKVLSKETNLTSKDILAKFKRQENIEVENLPQWKAEEICASAKEKGLDIVIHE